MIKKLTTKHKKQVLEFVYKRERENLFIIGSFKNYKNTFKENDFFGYFEDKKLIGLGVNFRRYDNYVINAKRKKIINELLDYAIKKGVKIETIAAFKRYAQPMVDRLQKIYKIKPKKRLSYETVYTLKQKDFKDFSEGGEETATKKDVDEIITFTYGKKKKDITSKDRSRIYPQTEFIIRDRNKIASKGNIHGVSNKYFQIGGVGTLKKHRRKGYAIRVISYLCKHYFNQGIKYGLLFTGNDNLAAQRLYKKIGFKPVDEFIIAEY